MGLIWCDSCDGYGATADIQKRWTGDVMGAAIAYNATAGVHGGGAIQCVNTQTSIKAPVNLVFYAANAKINLAFAMKVSAIPSSNTTFLDFRTLAGAFTGGLRLNTSTGIFTLLNNASTVLATGTTNVCDGNFHWVEISFSVGNSQVHKCYVDGVVQWNATLSNNPTANIWGFYFTFTSNGTCTLDDVIWFDDSVAQSPMTSDIPIGPREIQTIRPSGDNSIQFTRNTGSNNYSCVNEQAPDDDTTYVQDATSGHIDLYDYADLPFVPRQITAVQICTVAKNPNGGYATLKTRTVSGASSNDGAAQQLGNSYRLMREIYNRDPLTNAAWLPTNLNAAQFGIKVG